MSTGDQEAHIGLMMQVCPDLTHAQCGEKLREHGNVRAALAAHLAGETPCSASGASSVPPLAEALSAPDVLAVPVAVAVAVAAGEASTATAAPDPESTPESKLQHCVAMGFDATAAGAWLTHLNGDLEASVEKLLLGMVAPTAPLAPPAGARPAEETPKREAELPHPSLMVMSEVHREAELEMVCARSYPWRTSPAYGLLSPHPSPGLRGTPLVLRKKRNRFPLDRVHMHVSPGAQLRGSCEAGKSRVGLRHVATRLLAEGLHKRVCGPCRCPARRPLTHVCPRHREQYPPLKVRCPSSSVRVLLPRRF